MILTNNPACLRIREAESGAEFGVSISKPGVTVQPLRSGGVELTISIGRSGVMFTIEPAEALALHDWLCDVIEADR